MVNAKSTNSDPQTSSPLTSTDPGLSTSTDPGPSTSTDPGPSTGSSDGGSVPNLSTNSVSVSVFVNCYLTAVCEGL